MQLLRLLEQLGYSDSGNFLRRGTREFELAADIGHILRAAGRGCRLEGVYSLRPLQDEESSNGGYLGAGSGLGGAAAEVGAVSGRDTDHGQGLAVIGASRWGAEWLKGTGCKSSNVRSASSCRVQSVRFFGVF